MTVPVPTVLALLGLQPFFIVTALAAMVLVAAIFFGASRWQRPSGKAIAIASGLVLLLLAVFVVCVLFIAQSARSGAPM